MDLKELFHTINTKRKVYFDEILEDFDLNFIELEILVFLQNTPNCNTFTEIMNSKGYAKSHISNAISNLIEKEYLVNEADANNKKVFHLRLLDKSAPVAQKYDTCVRNFQADAFANITQDNLDTFEQVLQQISNNLTEE